MDVIRSEKRKLSKKTNKSFLSIQENEIDFIDVLKTKAFLSIYFNNDSIPLHASKKSVFKIINLLTDTKIGLSLEINLAKYIICTIQDESISFMFADESSCNSSILELPYQKLLDQTKQYTINIVDSNITSKNIQLNLLSNQTIKIIIKSKSIDKICKYLNSTLYKFADYIQITIISFQKQDKIKNILEKSVMKQKTYKLDFVPSFLGVKKFETNYEIPLRNLKNPIYKLDDIFEQILGKIEDKSSDEDSSNMSESKSSKSSKSLSLSETNLPKVKNNTNTNNLNLSSSISISSSIVNPLINNLEEKDFEKEFNSKSECQKNICPNCIIF